MLGMYDELLRSGRIREEKVSRTEVNRVLKRAARDLKTAKKIIADDPDWGFAVAYNAILQASRAYMFSRGYRPESAQGHKNTFAFMAIALGKENEDLITYFDRMRKKRNQAIYDISGLITETEVKNLYRKAENFVSLIRERLKKRS
jgi:uncharacterized protein (UPF0332 family)